VGQESPAHWIERHRAELRVLDEDGFLAAVRAIPALADSDSPSWEQEEPWDDAYRLLAAADVIGERGWIKPSCRSLNGPPGVIYTRPCSGFAMVPSGQPGRISWRRCWSR
jgi:hypothetical protein